MHQKQGEKSVYDEVTINQDDTTILIMILKRVCYKPGWPSLSKSAAITVRIGEGTFISSVAASVNAVAP
jgi:hypothetical protein